MARNIPTGITRDHVILALKDLDRGIRGGFADSIKYDLVHEGRRYPPKAVLGLAVMHLTGRALTPDDFSGGKRSACFRILRSLQFRIEPKPHLVTGMNRDEPDEHLDRNEVALDIRGSVEHVPEPDLRIREIFASISASPPKAPPRSSPASSGIRQPGKYDFASRDAANRDLGRRGEEFVLRYERWRLTEANRLDLAAQVTWVSESLGDGAGFDIESRSLDGSKIYIEVKTTNCAKNAPFLLTANELEASRRLAEAYWLYRLYDFSRRPRMYTVNGELDSLLDLRPTVFESRGVRI